MSPRAAFAAWWHARTARERGLLAAAAAVLALAVAVQGIWAPYQAQKAELASRVAAYRDALATLQEREAEIARLRARAASRQSTRFAEGRSLLAGLGDSLAKAGLRESTDRLEPAGDGRVQLAFDQVAFGRLMGWLDEAARQGLRVTRARIERRDGGNQVRARLTVARAEG